MSLLGDFSCQTGLQNTVSRGAGAWPRLWHMAVTSQHFNDTHTVACWGPKMAVACDGRYQAPHPDKPERHILPPLCGVCR